jgi:cytochrome b561
MTPTAATLTDTTPGPTLVVPPRFTPIQRVLHWSMAVCILAMLFIGVGMVSTVTQRYLTLVSIHKPLGIAILLLVLVRIAVRLRAGAPPLPADLPEPMKLAAHLSHYAFYALMLAMPLIGWGMLSAAAYQVKVLGLTLPPILPQSDALHSLLWTTHRTLAFAFFALILLHLGPALFHGLVRRDAVFEAMAPVSDRTRARPRR